MVPHVVQCGDQYFHLDPDCADPLPGEDAVVVPEATFPLCDSCVSAVALLKAKRQNLRERQAARQEEEELDVDDDASSSSSQSSSDDDEDAPAEERVAFRLGSSHKCFASGYDFGRDPSRIGLPALDGIERTLISRVMHFTKIDKIRHSVERSCKISHHTIAFPHDGSQRFADTLPNYDAVREHYHVLFMGTTAKRQSEFHQWLTAPERGKVMHRNLEVWLQFLVEYHEGYRDIDLSGLDQSKIDAFLKSFLEENTGVVDNPKDIIEDAVAEAAVGTGMDGEDAPTERSKSTVLCPNPLFAPDTTRAIVEAAKELRRDERTVKVTREAEKPASEFDPNFLPNAFPWLFPCWQNEHVGKRARNVLYCAALREKGTVLRHLLLGNHRIAQDANFQFLLFDQFRRYRVGKYVNATPRQAEKLDKILNSESYETSMRLYSEYEKARVEAVKQHKDPNTVKEPPALKRFVSDLQRLLDYSTETIPFTNASRKRLTAAMYSNNDRHGPPSVYHTCTFTDMDSRLILQFTSPDNDQPPSKRWQTVELSKRIHNAAQNPVYAAEVYETMITLVLEVLIGAPSNNGRYRKHMIDSDYPKAKEWDVKLSFRGLRSVPCPGGEQGGAGEVDATHPRVQLAPRILQSQAQRSGERPGEDPQALRGTGYNVHLQ